MKSESPTEFLTRNAIKFTPKGREAVTDCPKCGKEAHCFLNLTTWLWHCKKCDCRGNEASFKVALGLQYQVASTSSGSVDDEQERQLARELRAAHDRNDVERWTQDLMHHKGAELARHYLLQRGLPLDLCERYRVGWCQEPDGSTPRSQRRVGSETVPSSPGWIVLPSFTKWEQGRPSSSHAAVVKLRSVPPSDRAFRRLVGGDSVLFAPNGIEPTSTLLIVGGEIDALSCVVAGWPNTISSTVGEPNWTDGATAQLESVEDVVIIYDQDEAGRKGAAMVADKLGPHRCRIGCWPQGCKDANEALQKLGKDFDIASLVAQAKPSGGDSIIKVDDIRSEYLSELRGGKPRGVSSGWEDLDLLVGGIRWGEVTLVTGDTASGKSTFTSQFALNMATQGFHVLFCPFELGARRQLAKWVRQCAKAAPDTLDDQTLSETLDTLNSLPLYLLKRYGQIKVEAMRNTMLHCIRRMGVKVVVLDHLHFMVSEGPEERTELDAMMKMVAEIAVDTKVHVVVVAHPRQHHSSNETHKDNRIIQASDLKGSAGLKQLSDNIWSVWRPRKADRSDARRDEATSSSVVYVLKNRDDYGNEGSVAFRFGLQSATFEAEGEPESKGAKMLSSYLPPKSEDGSKSAPRPARRLRRVPVDIHNPPHWAETDKEDK